MRRAPASSATRGLLFAVALLAVPSSVVHLPAQDAPKHAVRRGAILVQTTDTAINPIPAELVLPGFGVAIHMSEEGIVLLNVPDGLHLIQARRFGYRPDWRFARVAGDTTQIDFTLPPLDIRRGMKAAAIAESRLREFLRRSAVIPLGSFVTRAEIERRRPRSLLALLARVSDITVDRRAGGPPVVRSRHVRGAHCAAGMLVLVDARVPVTAPLAGPADVADAGLAGRIARGDRWRLPARAVNGPGGRGEMARRSTGSTLGGPAAGPASEAGLERIPVSRVAGVEVYPMLPSVPVEFRLPGSECGLVLIWTTGS